MFRRSSVIRYAVATAAALTLSTMVAARASAQGPAVSQPIQARADVAAALTVSGTDLSFGTVFQGINKTVAPSDLTAGRFAVTGAASSGVNVTWTSVPTVLTNSVSGTTMPIGSWTGCANGVSDGSAAGGCTTSINFAGTTAATLSASGELYIFVGATVQPAATQAAGTYAAPVTVQIAYNGL
ncbi:MAG TPA: hypothetical protein VFK13_07165 [Gemmatimonadaceae bacterium]|nr:hypothetical protein [Gemmatimonadaceae bacterium]